jgi:serine/threonine protein kinase
MSNWVGQTLGKVHIDSLLARGGMAEVYVGTHTTLQRKVAVKILRNQYDEHPDMLERFEREARVVANLRHPNIVQVFDFDTVDGSPYLVMEYIRGPSLSKYLYALHQDNRRLEYPIVVRLLDAMANALQYAHNKGVIHRDVKPGNILLTSRTSQVVTDKPLPADFEPVLTDFGLVRFLNASRQTTVGHIAGTPAYMSPEQARGDQTDGRTDIYSLGIVLYEILAGHLPFDGETTTSILLKHLNEPPAPIPGLPPLMQRVLDRALAKAIKDRFQTPTEFAEAFSAAVEGRMDHSTIEMETPAPVLSPPKTNPRPKQRWIFAALTTVTVLALGGFILFQGFSPSANTTPTSSSPTSQPITNTALAPIILPLGPTGILRFQDENAIADQATLTARAMPAPPVGSQFEVWLIGFEDRRSLGILSLDANGKGTLTFTDSQGANLIALYDQVEITLEPYPDPDPASSGQVAYTFTLPTDGLLHIRYLLASFPNAPMGNALIQGLYKDTESIDETAREMLKAYESGDEAGGQQSAEAMMNLMVGNQSQDFQDWNGDGQITEGGDGYGLLLNRNNLGYIQAVYSEADYATNTPGATQKMIVNGENVKICAQNLALWAPQLRTLLLTILSSTSGSDSSQPMLDVVALADQMLNGTDLDGNGKVEPASGECGAKVAYEYAYYMADMPILPVGVLSNTITPVGTYFGTLVVGTPSQIGVRPTTTRVSSQNTPVPPANTAKPKPTQKPHPTPKPKNNKP